MNEFIKSYLGLLIKQYYYKPKASAEIMLYASEGSNIFDLFNAVIPSLDIDYAVGNQLDIIGKLVGINRTVPFALARKFFGFEGQENARTFADKYDSSIVSAPFRDKFSRAYTDLQLDDEDYRFFIKAKISVNNASAFMLSDDRTSIQDVIQYLFEGEAYVSDNLDMTMTLYISPRVDISRLRLINALNLLPKPQGVRYKIITKAQVGKTFGFKDNPMALTFADKFNQSTLNGYFADKVFL